MGTKIDEKWIAIGLVVLSGVLGLLVHPFYDWTGSDQSRPSPLLWRVPIILAVLCGLFCLAMPWLQISRNEVRSFRFKLRDLLIATAGVGLLAVIGSRFPLLVVASVFFFVVVFVVASSICGKHYRTQTATMFCVMYLPYLWLPFHFEFNTEFSELFGMLLGLPGFLPSIFASQMLNQHPSETIWMPPLITSVQMVVGFVLIRVGPRWTLAYFCLLMLGSAIGSLGLNAAMRV